MKKIITMVGASIFENFFEEKKDVSIKSFYDDIKEKKADEWESEKDRIKKLKKSIIEWAISNSDKSNISAEIKSLIKIKEEIGEDLKIYFLCSDTILSKLAAEIIEEIIEEEKIDELNGIDVEIKVIEGLQIWDRKEFNKGMSNLISEIYSISDGYWENMIINITGGYKATIPYLTILAQLNNCPIYYIFEETDALMKIPNIPFSTEWFNWDELSNFTEWFEKLEDKISNDETFYKLKNSDFYKKYSFLIWEEKPLAELNPIGKIVFEKLKEKFFIFYATDEVIKMIENDNNLKRIFEIKFCREDIRENKTENKKKHRIYDNGDNQIRIFYLKDEKDNIFVYKVFNSHDEYERFLDENLFNEKEVKSFKYTLYKFKKEVSNV